MIDPSSSITTVIRLNTDFNGIERHRYFNIFDSTFKSEVTGFTHITSSTDLKMIGATKKLSLSNYLVMLTLVPTTLTVNGYYVQLSGSNNQYDILPDNIIEIVPTVFMACLQSDRS